jgi:hypothetical protein
MATYPNGIASWTNRIDNVNTVWAADPNTLAGELVAVETSVGTNPQIESAPIAGNPITYPSMSARLSDTLSGRQLPYVTVSAQDSFDVRYGSALDGYGQFNVYTHSASDMWGWYNGSDITVGVSGIYVVDVEQDWEYSTSGYYKLALTINNINLRSQVWHWDFPSGSASNYSANFAGRQATMGFSTVREFVAGTRIRVVSENGTAKNPVTAENASLTLQYLRQATVGGTD